MVDWPAAVEVDGVNVAVHADGTVTIVGLPDELVAEAEARRFNDGIARMNRVWRWHTALALVALNDPGRQGLVAHPLSSESLLHEPVDLMATEPIRRFAATLGRTDIDDVLNVTLGCGWFAPDADPEQFGTPFIQPLFWRLATSDDAAPARWGQQEGWLRGAVGVPLTTFHPTPWTELDSLLGYVTVDADVVLAVLELSDRNLQEGRKLHAQRRRIREARTRFADLPLHVKQVEAALEPEKDLRWLVTCDTLDGSLTGDWLGPPIPAACRLALPTTVQTWEQAVDEGRAVQVRLGECGLGEVVLTEYSYSFLGSRETEYSVWVTRSADLFIEFADVFFALGRMDRAVKLADCSAGIPGLAEEVSDHTGIV